MRFILIAIMVLTASYSYATEKASDLSMTSVEEMYSLVAEKSDSRRFLWCSIVSGKLEMEDVRQLFVRKASAFSDDSVGFLMAHSYMTGFVDSEVLQLEGETQDAGNILGHLYSAQCMKELLPKSE